MTATGGYHCHRDEDDDKALLIAVGVVVLLAALYWLGKRKARPAMLAGEPPPRRNPLIPMPHVMTDQTGAAEVRAVWKIGF